MGGSPWSCLQLRQNDDSDVMFHCGRKLEYSPELCMGGRRLQYSDKMTYLGIMFSKRLSWTNHIKSRVHQCTYLLHRPKVWSENNGG